MVFLKSLKKFIPLFIVLLAIVFYPLANLLTTIPNDFGGTLRSIGLLANIILLGIFFWHYRRTQGHFSRDFLYQLIILGAFFIRLSYAYSTNIFLRQHDIGALSINDSGHYGYILQIFNNGRLPVTNNYQFYHPPLYHLLSALWLHGVALLFPSFTTLELFNTLPIMSLIIGYLVVYVAYLIIKLKDHYFEKGLPLLLLVSFHPIFILLSGRHNNDNLSILFIMLTIYFLIKWRAKRRWPDIIGLALAIGLGMMTKLTVAVITPLIGIYMVVDFVQSIKETDDRGRPAWILQLAQLIFFALIVFPLGLWYPIRNFMLFNQPLNYVFLISNPALATDTYTWYQRFLIVDFNGLVNQLYANAGADYSMWFYILKTSVFGEFSYWGAHVFAVLLLLVNTILSIILAIIFFKRTPLLFKKYNHYDELFMGYTIILFLAYILFNLQYPFGPTMDFRYLIPIVINSGFLLIFEKKDTVLFHLSQTGIIIFSVLSLCFFTFLY